MKLADGRNVLITGGAGFIGSHLAEALLERGCAVRIVDDFSFGRPEYVPAGAELIEGDVHDRDVARAGVDGIDVVLHLAMSNLRISLSDPWPSHHVNAGGTLQMLLASVEAGVGRFLFCSTSEVYGSARTVPMSEEHITTPTTVYGASKLAGEWYTLSFDETAGLDARVVRPFNTYGPREHHEDSAGEVIPKMALRILNGLPPVIFGEGTQTRDFTYVTDTVAGLLAAAESDRLRGEVVNVAAGREVTILRIAELVRDACGVDIEPEHRPPRPADVMRHFADVRKARELLDYEPVVPIEEGIPRYVEWLRTEHADDLATMLGQDRERNWEPAG